MQGARAHAGEKAVPFRNRRGIATRGNKCNERMKGTFEASANGPIDVHGHGVEVNGMMRTSRAVGAVLGEFAMVQSPSGETGSIAHIGCGVRTNTVLVRS